VDLSIRPMASAEEKLVRDSWTRSFDAPVGESVQYMRIGGESRMVGWAWFARHRAFVKSLWPSLTILVATLRGHDEAMGWIALTEPGDHPLVVHYAFVIEVARKRGVGEALLRAALDHGDGRPTRYSHMNSLGRHMVAQISTAARRTMPAEVAMR
jgi:hypothetical protein